jgi:hypothetical protein
MMDRRKTVVYHPVNSIAGVDVMRKYFPILATVWAALVLFVLAGCKSPTSEATYTLIAQVTGRAPSADAAVVVLNGATPVADSSVQVSINGETLAPFFGAYIGTFAYLNGDSIPLSFSFDGVTVNATLVMPPPPTTSIVPPSAGPAPTWSISAPHACTWTETAPGDHANMEIYETRGDYDVIVSAGSGGYTIPAGSLTYSAGVEAIVIAEANQTALTDPRLTSASYYVVSNGIAAGVNTTP